MFPLRDVIPSRTTPVVTILIIVLNVLAFFYEQSFDQQGLDVFLRTWGFVPAVFAWPTIFTSMFLHGGLWHLAGNMRLSRTTAEARSSRVRPVPSSRAMLRE